MFLLGTDEEAREKSLQKNFFKNMLTDNKYKFLIRLLYISELYREHIAVIISLALTLTYSYMSISFS